MRVSLDLINSLMKAIRQIERQNAALSWSAYGSTLEKHLLENEMYFSLRLKDDYLQKFNYYQTIILGENIEYEEMINDSKKLILLRDINNEFVTELLVNKSVYDFQLKNLDSYGKNSIDFLLDASRLFYNSYIEYTNNSQKYEFATVMANAYLSKLSGVSYPLYISEVINSNNVLFTSSFIDEEKFVIAYLKLIEAQIKKNNERFAKFVELSKQNEQHFDEYSVVVRKFLEANAVFTIISFAEECELSYNTAKKYLKELVSDSYLTPVKISRNNAFIYTELYEIWLK